MLIRQKDVFSPAIRPNENPGSGPKLVVMVSLSLDPLRRLLGAAGRRAFALSRPSGDESVPGADLIYRLKSWPSLPEAGRTLDVYRMLSVMSSRPVNGQWIHARVRMEPQQLEALLRQWVREGALEVIDPARFARSAA